MVINNDRQMFLMIRIFPKFIIKAVKAKEEMKWI